MSALLYIACIEANAIYGVAIQFFAFNSGCAGSIGGSISNTSTAAPAILVYIVLNYFCIILFAVLITPLFILTDKDNY